MKKLLSVLLSAVILLFSVSACFGGLAADFENKAYKRKTAEIKDFSNKLNALIDAYDNQPKVFSAIASTQSDEEAVSQDELFATARLIVYADGDIDERGAAEHLYGLEDMHILQYETKEQAIQAYEFYCTSKNIDSVEPDVILTLDDDEDVLNNVSMTADDVKKASDYDYSDNWENTDIRHSWGYDFIQTPDAFKYILQSISMQDLPEIVVGVIDDGIGKGDDAFNQRLINAYTFLGDDADPYVPTGQHGTRVAAVIYENTLPNVKFVSYQVMENGGASQSVTSLAERQAALDGVDIINSSYSGVSSLDLTPVKSHSAKERIDNEKPLHIASAGNHGTAQPYQPACFPSVISVANLASNSKLDVSSARGTKHVDVAAPGTGTEVSYQKGEYKSFGGTSCAAPFVVSVCAMLMSYYSNASNVDIAQMLFDSCSSEPKNVIFGTVNMFKAISYGDPNAYQTKTPQFSLESMPETSNSYNETQYLELTCSDENAEIYYTLDKTIPSKSNGILYTQPIELSETATVWAVAYSEKGAKSDIAKRNFYLWLSQDAPSDENGWLIRDNGMIYGYIGPETDLVVPETVLGIPVEGIEKEAFSEQSQLSSIVMPECLTEIEEKAFYKCINLSSTTALGVKTMGSSAFSGCYCLDEVSMPNLEVVKKGSFKGTGLLKGLPFENLKEVRMDAFSGSDISYVNLENATIVSDGAFFNCLYLVEAHLPKVADSEYFGGAVFKGCSSLKKVIVNPECDLLRWDEFFSSGLTIVDFLPNVLYSETSSFGWCYKLVRVELPELIETGEEMFLSDYSLTTVIMPKARQISNATFSDCSALKEVQLSDNIEQLEGEVFIGCNSLKYLKLYGDFRTQFNTFKGSALERLEMNRVQSLASLPDTQNCIIAMPSTFKECTEDTAGRNYKIYGTKGTYAEQWANENGHEFIEISQETALLQDVPMEYTGDETLSVDVIGFNRTYQWYGNTVADNMTGTPIDGATDKDFHPAEYPAYPYYYCVVTSTDVGYDPVEIRTGKTLSETILNPMSSQIRFKRNADGSYAKMFDVRSRAEISDEDFATYIANTNEEAITKISKVGFVYASNSTDFSIEDAQKVAKGKKVNGYTDAPVSYIQDADGYYMFTCIVKDIPVKDIEKGITAYAYICVEDKWYFYNAETTVNFKELHNAFYPQAAAANGWELNP